LYSKVFKNYQVNLGTPYNIKAPLNFHTIKQAEEIRLEEEEELSVPREDPADIISKAKEEAEFIIKEAELEAVRLIEKAKAEAEGIKTSAAEEGRKDGYSSGIETARKEYENLINEAEIIRQHARAEYEEILAGVESDIIELVIDVSRKVLGDEIRTDRECILQLVRKAFEKCQSRDGVTLRVGPSDYDVLNEKREKLLQIMEGAGEFEIKMDYSLKPGDCIVETPFGCIDAGVETKMQKIEEAFRQVIGMQSRGTHID
jgi:flagellar assembly protein FliH